MYELGIYSLLFFVSCLILSKSTHVVIKSAVRFAQITRLGEMVIGFLLLSLATNLPELSIAFNAIITQDIGITVGNILGSNVVGITLILGILSLFSPIRVVGKKLKTLSAILFLTTLIPLLLLFQVQISRIVGVLLILTFPLFAFYSVKKRITLELKVEKPTEFFKKLLWPIEYYKTLFFFVVGMFGVILSARFVVDSASGIASLLGIEQAVIGATIIAIGTQLPELSVVLASVKKGHVGLALSNLVGSNLVKITLVLGAVLAISPLLVDIGVFSTLLFFVVVATILAWHFLSTGRMLDRTEGIVLLLVYIMFIITVFIAQPSLELLR